VAKKKYDRYDRVRKTGERLGHDPKLTEEWIQRQEEYVPPTPLTKKQWAARRMKFMLLASALAGGAVYFRVPGPDKPPLSPAFIGAFVLGAGVFGYIFAGSTEDRDHDL